MRNRMIRTDDDKPSLAGFVLVAHPALKDPNFRRSVVLVSAHNQSDGAIGVILNRPMGKVLEDFRDDFRGSPMGNIPLFHGGPVGASEMILTAWKPMTAEGAFRLFFGISMEKAEELIEADSSIVLRGFLGYSGWGEGQLEVELKQDDWFVSPLDGRILDESEAPNIWRDVLVEIKPELVILADAPEDPTMN